MPIFFNVPEVENFLLEHGYVYTIRKPRAIGLTMAQSGNWHKPETLIDIGYVNVQLELWDVREIQQLLKYVGESGLSQRMCGIAYWNQPYNPEIIARYWFGLAQELSGNILNLYKVSLI